MIQKFSLVVCFFLLTQIYIAQKREFKCGRINEAVTLIDNEKYNEAIQILRDCEKVDPTDYAYPYEIALALSYQDKFQESIDQLEKVKHYNNVDAHLFQLLGNNYDYLDQPQKAISVYEEGLRKFPKAGRLYLEKGVVLEIQKKLKDAIFSYEKGVSVDPMYPSNYFRLSKIYLNSNDKLSGLINGEIFVNLERTTKRTQEISKLLIETYQKSVEFSENQTKINFCEVIIDSRKYEQTQKLPFCAIFGTNFITVLSAQSKINLETLAQIRKEFLTNYFKGDHQKYPNVLFNYHKKMLDNDVFQAYNMYVFQMGAPEEFEKWHQANPEKYQKFVEWYTDANNYLKINTQNLFISDSLK